MNCKSDVHINKGIMCLFFSVFSFFGEAINDKTEMSSSSVNNFTCETALLINPFNTSFVLDNSGSSASVEFSIPTADGFSNNAWFQDGEIQSPLFLTFTTSSTPSNFILSLGPAPFWGTVDLQLALLSSCSGDVVAANDNAGYASYPRITVTSDMLEPNHTYYILIDGNAGATGQFLFSSNSLFISPSSDQCTGDLDGDGFVNVSDISAMLAVFGSTCNE